MREPTARGLDPAVVAQWYTRLGVSNPETCELPTRFRGRSGLAAYSSLFSSVSTEHPDSYDSLIYHRQLSMMMAHCELHTPRRTELTNSVIRAQPIELVIVASHVLDGSLHITQHDTQISYGTGQLVILPLDSPFVNEVDSVSDAAMLLIPKRLLGLTHAGDTALILPFVADSLVSRSTAQFVRRFAADAALLGQDITPDMELNAIKMVRETIGLHNYQERRPHHDSIMVREAAAELIEQHYRDPQFSAHSIATALQMSRRHLYRHFADSESSPAQLITQRRLAHAMDLLAGPRDLPLDEVARQSGYLSAATLRARLHAEIGQTPSEFRRSVHPPG